MPTDEAWDVAERVAHEEGLFIGHSGGAGVAAAIRTARAVPEGETALIVTLLPDRGDRYFTPLKWEKHYEW
jgi:cysteine synthase B